MPFELPFQICIACGDKLNNIEMISLGKSWKLRENALKHNVTFFCGQYGCKQVYNAVTKDKFNE